MADYNWDKDIGTEVLINYASDGIWGAELNPVLLELRNVININYSKNTNFFDGASATTLLTKLVDIVSHIENTDEHWDQQDRSVFDDTVQQLSDLTNKVNSLGNVATQNDLEALRSSFNSLSSQFWRLQALFQEHELQPHFKETSNSDNLKMDNSHTKPIALNQSQLKNTRSSLTNDDSLLVSSGIVKEMISSELAGVDLDVLGKSFLPMKPDYSTLLQYSNSIYVKKGIHGIPENLQVFIDDYGIIYKDAKFDSLEPQSTKEVLVSIPYKIIRVFPANCKIENILINPIRSELNQKYQISILLFSKETDGNGTAILGTKEFEIESNTVSNKYVWEDIDLELKSDGEFISGVGIAVIAQDNNIDLDLTATISAVSSEVSGEKVIEEELTTEDIISSLPLITNGKSDRVSLNLKSELQKRFIDLYRLNQFCSYVNLAPQSKGRNINLRNAIVAYIERCINDGNNFFNDYFIVTDRAKTYHKCARVIFGMLKNKTLFDKNIDYNHGASFGTLSGQEGQLKRVQTFSKESFSDMENRGLEFKLYTELGMISDISGNSNPIVNSGCSIDIGPFGKSNAIKTNPNAHINIGLNSWVPAEYSIMIGLKYIDLDTFFSRENDSCKISFIMLAGASQGKVRFNYYDKLLDENFYVDSKYPLRNNRFDLVFITYSETRGLGMNINGFYQSLEEDCPALSASGNLGDMIIGNSNQIIYNFNLWNRELSDSQIEDISKHYNYASKMNINGKNFVFQLENTHNDQVLKRLDNENFRVYGICEDSGLFPGDGSAKLCGITNTINFENTVYDDYNIAVRPSTFSSNIDQKGRIIDFKNNNNLLALSDDNIDSSRSVMFYKSDINGLKQFAYLPSYEVGDASPYSDLESIDDNRFLTLQKVEYGTDIGLNITLNKFNSLSPNPDDIGPGEWNLDILDSIFFNYKVNSGISSEPYKSELFKINNREFVLIHEYFDVGNDNKEYYATYIYVTNDNKLYNASSQLIYTYNEGNNPKNVKFEYMRDRKFMIVSIGEIFGPSNSCEVTLLKITRGGFNWENIESGGVDGIIVESLDVKDFEELFDKTPGDFRNSTISILKLNNNVISMSFFIDNDNSVKLVSISFNDNNYLNITSILGTGLSVNPTINESIISLKHILINNSNIIFSVYLKNSAGDDRINYMCFGGRRIRDYVIKGDYVVEYGNLLTSDYGNILI